MSKPAPNFVWRDFIRSREYPDLELGEHYVAPSSWIDAMRVMLLSLQPFRDFAGRIGVLSFIRGDELNKAVGGIEGSDHLFGLAADFKTLDMPAHEFFSAIQRGHVPRATWDQLNIYTAPGTFHVAHRPLEDGGPRRRIYSNWERVG